MKKRKERACVLLVVGVVFSIFLKSAWAGGDVRGRFLFQRTLQGEDLADRPLLLFIIDFGMLMCPSCLDFFLGFYQEFSGLIEDGMAWGILILDKPSEENDKMSLSITIAEKKLRGFRQANDITFPILIDPFAVFAGLTHEGTALVLFDRSSSIVRRYNFPLTPSEKKELLEVLSR